MEETLTTIDTEQFKQLINALQDISVKLEKIEETLKKIDNTIDNTTID